MRKKNTCFRINTGESRHVCVTCGKAFSRTDDLTMHMRTHTGEKPHDCRTCGKAFSRKGNLDRHMGSHSSVL